MADWTVIESVTEYETGWYTGGYDLVEQPDGTTKRYYWAELPPAVVVVGLTDDEVVQVEQYRPTVRERHEELPAGIVEPGESFETAGGRELREETGFDPATVEPLADYWAATGVLRHRRAVVVATDLERVETDRDENEFLSVTRIPFDAAVDRALSRSSNDATLEGLLLAERAGYLDGSP